MSEGIPNGLSYRSAGVDIDAGNAFVRAIRPFVRATRRPGADAEIGGFGGVFDLKAAGYRDPLLVAATDGVGTKLKVAIVVGKHDTIGIDLVAMSVNDLVVQGAEPLLFLDYYATGKLSVEIATDIVKGIAEGCLQSGCALVGGETAEMPGLYAAEDYDLAGFAMGAVERGALLPKGVAAGDVVLGLASSGVHSNGMSLARRVVEASGASFAAAAPFDGTLTIGEALLTPTRIYVRSLLPLIKAGALKALAHITGGGLPDNVPRIMPDGLSAEIDLTRIPVPAIFRWIAAQGRVAPFEMLRTFNCGIGMVLFVEPDRTDEVTRSLTDSGETVVMLGRVGTGGEGVAFTGTLAL